MDSKRGTDYPTRQGMSKGWDGPGRSVEREFIPDSGNVIVRDRKRAWPECGMQRRFRASVFLKCPAWPKKRGREARESVH